MDHRAGPDDQAARGPDDGVIIGVGEMRQLLEAFSPEQQLSLCNHPIGVLSRDRRWEGTLDPVSKRYEPGRVPGEVAAGAGRRTPV